VLLAAALAACGGGGSSSSTTTNAATTASAATHAQAPRVVVPKLIGKHYRLAVRELHHRGLTAHAPGFTGSYSSTGMNGCETILHQAPPPGAKIPEHTSVAIIIGLAHC
jgi:beta-lactam-binding protein with PASTA domain